MVVALGLPMNGVRPVKTWLAVDIVSSSGRYRLYVVVILRIALLSCHIKQRIFSIIYAT
jgi:hypothetical protein